MDAQQREDQARIGRETEAALRQKEIKRVTEQKALHVQQRTTEAARDVEIQKNAPTEHGAPSIQPSPCQPNKSWIEKGPLFLKTILMSRKVPAEVLAMRDAACNACPHMIRRGDGRFCGCCGCGQWLMAELGIKNLFSQWFCPMTPPRFGAWKRSKPGRGQSKEGDLKTV